jgi:hypothetical protein
MDAECISFLQTKFGRNTAELFKYIPRGMYKADLWRLCKLYIHGGVYADIDLVPHFAISDGLDGVGSGSDATFYSCLNISYDSIFQAFMKQSRARSPLLLGCLISFLLHKPYIDTGVDNGPTRDMYQFLLYNIRHQTQHDAAGVTGILPHTRYTLRQIRIPVSIPGNEDIIPLYYFPDDIKYSISISPDTKDMRVLANKDKYRFYIKDHHLFVDADAGADANADTGAMVVDICIDLPEDEPEVIFLFEECIRVPNNISTCYISHQNKNIMDCRDVRYVRDRGWTN